MQNIPKLLVCVAALSFVVGVIAVFTGGLAGVPAESFSRAANNLSLIAIALLLLGKPGATT